MVVLQGVIQRSTRDAIGTVILRGTKHVIVRHVCIQVWYTQHSLNPRFSLLFGASPNQQLGTDLAHQEPRKVNTAPTLSPTRAMNTPTPTPTPTLTPTPTASLTITRTTPTAMRTPLPLSITTIIWEEVEIPSKGKGENWTASLTMRG